MQKKKLTKLGEHYYQMIIMPEVNIVEPISSSEMSANATIAGMSEPKSETET